MRPVVSVVIACRNAERTLGVQLAALARQNCPVPWNVVISDNGSTDGTVAVARGFASRLPGLVVVDSSGRLGAGHARNVGCQATEAPLLVFCDADDEAAPGWLAAMVETLRQDQFVAGQFESDKLNRPRVLRSRSLQQSDGLQESSFGPGLPHAGAGNLGVRREVFFRVGGFDPVVGCLEDTDLCWRIQLDGVPLVFSPEAVMQVRLRSSLRTIWAQGCAYGAATALLEHRYPANGVSPLLPWRAITTGQPAVPPASRHPLRRPAAGWGAKLLELIRDQRSFGSLVWTLGWHVGHRRQPPVSAILPTRDRALDTMLFPR